MLNLHKYYKALLSRNQQLENFHNIRTGHLLICAPTTHSTVYAQFEGNILKANKLELCQDWLVLQMQLNNLIKACNLGPAFILTVTDKYSLLLEMCNKLKSMLQYCENVTVVLQGHGTQDGQFELHCDQIYLNTILQHLEIFCVTNNIITKRLTIVFGNCYGHLFNQSYQDIFNIKSFTNDNYPLTRWKHRLVEDNNGTPGNKTLIDSVNINLQEFYIGTYGLSKRHFWKEFRQAFKGQLKFKLHHRIVPQYHI